MGLILLVTFTIIVLIIYSGLRELTAPLWSKLPKRIYKSNVDLADLAVTDSNMLCQADEECHNLPDSMDHGLWALALAAHPNDLAASQRYYVTHRVKSLIAQEVKQNPEHELSEDSPRANDLKGYAMTCIKKKHAFIASVDKQTLNIKSRNRSDGLVIHLFNSAVKIRMYCDHDKFILQTSCPNRGGELYSLNQSDYSGLKSELLAANLRLNDD